MEVYEGDLIRPLGFVTLYFAYAEGQLDEVLKLLTSVTGSRDSKVLSFGSKVGEAKDIVASIGAHKLPGLVAALEEVRPIVEARNELVHGQLFNGGRLVSKTGTRTVTAKEIEDLAEQIFSWKERLWERHNRELIPLASQMAADLSRSELPAAQQHALRDPHEITSS
jgi:hypothetical protein